MGSKTNSAENLVLNALLNTSVLATSTVVYSALFTAISSDAADGTEVTTASSGYTRQATTFCTAGATVAGQCVNTGAVTYNTAAAAYTVVGWALYDAETGGTELYWATVTTLAVGIGDQATFGVGNITITED
jgi:hypothetical protein